MKDGILESFDTLDISGLHTILDAMPDLAVVLDTDRRAVFINKALLAWLGTDHFENLVGLRPGTLWGCVRSQADPDACGETEGCTYCGANLAIQSALISQQTKTGECRITILKDSLPVSLDLRIGAHPFGHRGKTWLLVTIKDISDQKRRQTLEKIFFHDIINTAGALKGLLELMSMVEDPLELQGMAKDVSSISDRLLEEIRAQKELSQAENGELHPYPDRHLAATLVREAVRMIASHPVAVRYRIKVDIGVIAPELVLQTDGTLLTRVLVNMLKNAVEASRDGAIIQMAVQPILAGAQAALRFSVHNDGFMNREVQLQLFQRSFSTKASNRGLGTYSMKLLTERYLNGSIAFESGPDTGTTFWVDLPL